MSEVKDMIKRPRYRTAMTLMELLIAVAIIGIMAAVVYPHFRVTTEDADENKHKAQLRLIRLQIEVYRVQHGGAIPNLIASWDDLTKTTTYRGHTYGPYLNKVPASHKRSNVFDGNNVDPPDKYGFVYDYHGGAGTGAIYATNGSGQKLYKF